MHPPTSLITSLPVHLAAPTSWPGHLKIGGAAPADGCLGSPYGQLYMRVASPCIKYSSEKI